MARNTPQDTLDLLHSKYRFKRHLSLQTLREQLGREKGHCTWCNGPLKSNHMRWCSESCRTEGLVRSGGSQAAWLVQQRDHGVCEECGLDTLRLKERLKRLLDKARKRPPVHCHSFFRARRIAFKVIGGIAGQPWHCDHILPVVEGGGCCGLENLQTLCIACHKKDTAAIAKRRARKQVV